MVATESPTKRPRYYRRVITIRAEDSPNVRYAMEQLARGIEPTDEVIVPGVLTYGMYKKRRATWDKIRQCIGLDAKFYEGSEVRLYPPEWLAISHRRADELVSLGSNRQAEAMGVDPAEGGDKTVWTIIDRLGIIEQIGLQTPDTAFVPNRTIALIEQYKIPHDRVLFDRGGGGYEHTCTLAERGYKVRSVGFGETVSLPPRRGLNTLETRVEAQEESYAYLNRRAEMYGDLRFRLLDPAKNPISFGIPARFEELIRQLTPLPLWYDKEGRMYLPPKQRKSGDRDKDTKNKELTINDLIGCSPDESDSLVLAIHAMLHSRKRIMVGSRLGAGTFGTPR